MTRQPNILFIQVDQMTAASLRAYGNRFCHAPHLDRLAESGAVFENAYCNFPLCSPSRFSMAAGQLCSRIGAYDNAAEMPASVPTYAHFLRRLGYQTAISGKMHFIGPDQYHGFETRLTPDLYPADFSWVPNWGDEGKRDTNDPRSVLISGVCERSVQIDFDEQVTHQAVQHLYDVARADDERPFFLQVSYTHPHEPYLCRQEFWDLYRDADIGLPRVGAMPAERHDAHSARLLADFGMLDYAFKDEDILRSRRAYYGSVSYIDQLIGQVLAALESIGAQHNTAILFTSDHGDMIGERGMWFKKHFFEPSLRVPLFLTAPWISPQRVRELVSLVDILPTLAGLGTERDELDAPEPLDGIDLSTLLDRGDPPPERTVRAEYLAEATTAPIFMIRRGRFKYISSVNAPSCCSTLRTTRMNSRMWRKTRPSPTPSQRSRRKSKPPGTMTRSPGTSSPASGGGASFSRRRDKASQSAGTMARHRRNPCPGIGVPGATANGPSNTCRRRRLKAFHDRLRS
jgi:choline-sulfatase